MQTLAHDEETKDPPVVVAAAHKSDARQTNERRPGVVELFATTSPSGKKWKLVDGKIGGLAIVLALVAASTTLVAPAAATRTADQRRPTPRPQAATAVPPFGRKLQQLDRLQSVNLDGRKLQQRDLPSIDLDLGGEGLGYGFDVLHTSVTGRKLQQGFGSSAAPERVDDSWGKTREDANLRPYRPSAEPIDSSAQPSAQWWEQPSTPNDAGSGNLGASTPNDAGSGQQWGLGINYDSASLWGPGKVGVGNPGAHTVFKVEKADRRAGKRTSPTEVFEKVEKQFVREQGRKLQKADKKRAGKRTDTTGYLECYVSGKCYRGRKLQQADARGDQVASPDIPEDNATALPLEEAQEVRRKGTHATFLALAGRRLHQANPLLMKYRGRKLHQAPPLSAQPANPLLMKYGGRKLHQSPPLSAQPASADASEGDLVALLLHYSLPLEGVLDRRQLQQF